MYTKSQKLVAEALGTFGLVFFGVGAAMAGADVVGTSLAFGLSVLVAVLTIGKISGAHLNPAVSFGMFFDGRMKLNDAVGYSIAQTVGAVCASLCHLILVACGAFGKWTMDEDGEIDKLTQEIGDCSFGANYFGSMNFFGALLVEIILTAVFVLVILSVTASKDEHTQKNAGWFIGLALTFVHLMGINLTGTSVNPARSIGPAIFGAGGTHGHSLLQLWVFIVGPLAGAFVAALIYGAIIKDKNN